jgi:vacuolar ATPase assembly integral membrane protein VMA21
MATRRIVSQEKTLLDTDDRIGTNPAAGEKSDIAPAVPTPVILKLLAFTLAMIMVPIGSYFVTVNMLFQGKTTSSDETDADRLWVVHWKLNVV